MADYNRDQMLRDERDAQTNPNKDEEPWVSVPVEREDDTFLKIARKAHERDITFNKMVNIIITDHLDYILKKRNEKFQPKPQLLNEDNWYTLKRLGGQIFCPQVIIQ